MPSNPLISTKIYYYFFILKGINPDKTNNPIQKYISFGKLPVKNNPSKVIKTLEIFIKNSLPHIYVILSIFCPRR